MPTTTRRQRRALPSSGWRLRVAAASTEWPGCTSTCGWASPLRNRRDNGSVERKLEAMARREAPLATTSMRR